MQLSKINYHLFCESLCVNTQCYCDQYGVLCIRIVIHYKSFALCYGEL